MPADPGEATSSIGQGDGLQVCPQCAARIDTGNQEPLARIECPVCGAPMRVERRLHQFTIVDYLGAGGTGEVYQALDRERHRLVALKLLRRELCQDQTQLAEVEQEIRTAASIDHPGVVKVFSVDHNHGQYYVATELAEKGSLEGLMHRQGRIDEALVLRIGRQVAGGLRAALEGGLVHRDVKPADILFADARTAKITDFGLALLAQHEAEARGGIWGAPYYIAPEKLAGAPGDFRSDIYSLGATLFHALAGRPPIDEEERPSLPVLRRIKGRAIGLRTAVPTARPATARLIDRMLRFDPGERHGAYGELIHDFQRALDRLTASRARRKPWKAAIKAVREPRSHLAAFLGLLLAVLVPITGAVAYTHRGRLFGRAHQVNGEEPVNPIAATSDDKVSATAFYEEARHEVVAGQYLKAQASLAALTAGGNLPQPLASWVRLHQGMATLFNHQPTAAREIFASLQHAGPFSRAPGERPLADFFVEISRDLASGLPIPPGAVKRWDKDSFEDLALLLIGQSNWEMGAFDEAVPFFRAYENGHPAAPYRWVDDYLPVARKSLHDYDLYRELDKKLHAPDADPAALRAELARARDRLQTTGKMVEVFYLAETKLREATGTLTVPANPAKATPPPQDTAENPPKPASSPAAKTAGIGASAARGASTLENLAGMTNKAIVEVSNNPHADVETVRWQTARDGYVQMVNLYRFDVAAAVVGYGQFTDPDLVHAQDLLKKRVACLKDFKKIFVADLNTHGGYPQAVTSRRNVTYPRGILSATPETFQATTPYGTVSVPWTDFAAKTILGIGEYFADSAGDAQETARRRWLLANFALETNQPRAARTLAEAAARDEPRYRLELASLQKNNGLSGMSEQVSGEDADAP